MKQWLRLAAALTLLMCSPPTEGQSYQQPKVVPLTQWPYTMFAGDFDGDKKQDLFVLQFLSGTPSTSTDQLFGIIFGAGPGNFTQLIPQGSINDRGSLASTVADVDGDGLSDYLFVQGPESPGASSLITVWFGTPQRTIRVAPPPTGGLNAFSTQGTSPPDYVAVMAVDLNGDEQLDAVAFDGANNFLYVLLNNGKGDFELARSYPLPQGGGALLAGDFNHDGKMDVLVHGLSGHAVTPFWGNGDGTLSMGTPYTLGGGIFSMQTADIDGDGLTDLVVEGAAGALSYFQGTTTGFRSNPMLVEGAQEGQGGLGGHLIGIADLNGDGVPDILTATPAGVSVLLGQRPPNSVLPYAPAYLLGGIYNAGPGRSSYALKDFNGDGRPDLAVDSPEGVAILFGNPDGSFQTSRAFAAGQPALSVATGVFTQSGHVDAVVSTAATQAQVLTGAGDGTFRAVNANGVLTPTTSQTGIAGLWSTLQTGDFNGDGKLDLLMTADGPNSLLPPSGTSTTGVNLQLGAGDGTFGPLLNLGFQSPHCQGSPASLYGRSAVETFNGFADLLTRDADSAQIFLGQAASPYLAVSGPGHVDTTCPSLHAHDWITAGNIDGDGTPKVVEQADGHLYVFGLGQNQPGDLSVDGALTTPSQMVAPALSSTFGGVSPTLGFPAFVGSMAIADLDRDGYADLLVAYHNMASTPASPTAAYPNYLYIWYSSGGGKFLTSAKHPVNPVRLTLSRNDYQVAVADVNGDGIPDLLLSDGYLLSVQLGVGDGTFGAETHYLAGQGINGLAAASLRGANETDLVIANGGTVFSNPVANGEVLGSNADVNTGGITVLLGMPQAPSNAVSGTVAASPEPSIYAQPFTLTANIVQPAGQVAATGTVDFSLDGTVVGTGPVVNGVASFPVTTAAITASSSTIFNAGAHALAAAYSGDANYSGTTLTGMHTVQGQPTTSQFTNLDQTIYYGQEIGYDYGVDAVFGAQAADPTESYQTLDGGTIEVFVNSTLACSDVFGMSGRCPDPPFEGFSVGTYSTYVEYLGNAYYALSTSTVYPVTVIPDYTATALASSANPSFEFQPLILTATVTAFYQPIDPTAVTPTPVGTVQFFDGSVLIGSAALNAQGAATVSVATLLVGTHSLTACYVVSLNFRPSCSPAVTQVVTLPAAAEATTTLLTSSVNPSVTGQAVTFAAVVETTGAIIQTPVGSVSFYDGTTLLGSAVLASGRAAFTTAGLALGVHPVTAVYSGSVLTAASTSAVLQQLVLVSLPPATGYRLVVDPTTISVGVGNSVMLHVSIVVGSNPYGKPFLLSCSQLPNEATCAFAQSALPAAGGTTTLTIGAAAPHTCGTTTPYFVAGQRLPWLALAGLGLVFVRRRRGVLLLVMLVSVAGCGGPCTDLGTQPFDYSFQVTATEQGAPAGTVYATETQAVTMHVHL